MTRNVPAGVNSRFAARRTAGSATTTSSSRARHIATWDGAAERFRFVDATSEEIKAAKSLQIGRDAWGIPNVAEK